MSHNGDAPNRRDRDEIRETEMETVIGYVLLLGVVLSVVLVIAGIIWHWAATGQLRSDYTVPKQNLFQFVVATVRGIATNFGPRLLLSLGIAVLMLVPYVRVLASVAFFAFVEKNWKYTLFTSVVLVVLTYSLFLR